jgi:hypothetical protein
MTQRSRSPFFSPHRRRFGHFATSVYSDDPAAHDRITTVRGSHRRTIGNLRRLSCPCNPLLCQQSCAPWDAQ